MPRFYFDLIDGKTVADDAGQILRNEALATQVANKLAADIYNIRPELRGKDFAISVRDEDGDEIHRAEVVHSDS